MGTSNGLPYQIENLANFKPEAKPILKALIQTNLFGCCGKGEKPIKTADKLKWLLFALEKEQSEYFSASIKEKKENECKPSIHEIHIEDTKEVNEFTDKISFLNCIERKLTGVKDCEFKNKVRSIFEDKTSYTDCLEALKQLKGQVRAKIPEPSYEKLNEEELRKQQEKHFEDFFAKFNTDHDSNGKQLASEELDQKRKKYSEINLREIFEQPRYTYKSNIIALEGEYQNKIRKQNQNLECLTEIIQLVERNRKNRGVFQYV